MELILLWFDVGETVKIGNVPHLFELKSKEAIGLCADWHASEVWQWHAGLHLARFLVSQEDAVLCQQEDPSSALQIREETVKPLMFLQRGEVER